MELAGRLDRFWAALIDRGIFLAVIAAGIGVMAVKDGAAGISLAVTVGIAALAVLLAVQIWLLTAHGQTIGKRIIGLRIVKVSDMTNGGFVTNVLLRAVANAAISAVPLVGTLYFFIDPGFIFRDDRRCVHDHLAGTCVIKA
jgi:uncharacterized RDD family membrane protein YckC